jgi:threonine/homoserine/homoserine lactone efflux protein
MGALDSLIAFALAAAVLTITPGTDTALVLRLAANPRAQPAAMAAAGIVLGCLFWGVMVAVGLGALLAASPLAFALLQAAGAAYLCWLGAMLILRPRRALTGEGADGAADEAGAMTRGGQWAPLRQGLLTNILNPKVGIFYVSFLPLFVPQGVAAGPFLVLLAAIHGLLGLIWFAAIIAAAARVRRVLAAPGAVTWLDRLTGGLFVGFGLKLALARV